LDIAQAASFTKTYDYLKALPEEKQVYGVCPE
jgi:hypothetical protein